MSNSNRGAARVPVALLVMRSLKILKTMGYNPVKFKLNQARLSTIDPSCLKFLKQIGNQNEKFNSANAKYDP